MDVGDEAVPFEPGFIRLRTVGRVCPHRRACIAPVQEIAELRTVPGGRTRHVPAADEAMVPVDCRVVLVAEGGNVRECHSQFPW